MKTLEFRKFKGLHIVCKRCARNIEVTQDPYNGCTHPIEKQRYKAMFTINGKRPSRDLKAREYNDAIKELIKFKEELTNPLRFKVPEPSKEVKFDLFTDCVLMFSDWLENIGVPRQEQKQRSSKYIKETVEYVSRLGAFLKNNDYNLNKLSIYDIDKHAIGKYYEHLEKTVKSTATFNHNLRALKNFYNFLINEMNYVIANPVKKIKLKYENPDPQSVDDNDFIKLLSSITEKDSVQIYNGGAKKNRYRPFIKDSFELAAYTGMRLEEVAILKYSDIKIDLKDQLEYMEGTDLKFQRTHNWDDTKPKKVVPIPITPELVDLLNRLDYKNHIGSDRYLIDGDSKMNRASLAKEMSHAFTFFRRKAGLPENISIKHLRKTFLTKLETQTGLSASAGYQKTPSVINKNYIDKRKVAEEIANKGFSYFGNNSRLETV